MSGAKGKCYLKRKRFLNEVSQEIFATLQQIYYLRNEAVSESVMKKQATKYAQTVEAACLTPKYKMSNDEYHNVLHVKTHELCEVLKRNMIPSNSSPLNSPHINNNSPAHLNLSNSMSNYSSNLTCNLTLNSPHNSPCGVKTVQSLPGQIQLNSDILMMPVQKMQPKKSAPDLSSSLNIFNNSFDFNLNNNHASSLPNSFPKESDMFPLVGKAPDAFEISGDNLFDSNFMKEDLDFGEAMSFSFM
ncbi:hypothetical protein TRFO_12782 [Tritrichomonas foetus]|uniref:Uncharacterized protein n=1 Tax=Tritrichomonas foetus TaxID=1144522 RepID=A0A1J4L076_9EUKA|nr:hypothetical protein TRFO_12782 [Tritrichomonas foetus]|eukprot:OHT16913.1 hypothetical protein TRFO_12782 [Tritrichomonas foetus]